VDKDHLSIHTLCQGAGGRDRALVKDVSIERDDDQWLIDGQQASRVS
jgi:hypothetical protein